MATNAKQPRFAPEVCPSAVLRIPLGSEPLRDETAYLIINYTCQQILVKAAINNL